MASFKDAQGRAWSVVIDATGVKRVTQRLGFHLGKLQDNNFAGLREVAGDVINLCDTLYVLCEDQAKALGLDLDSDAFGRLLDGDVFPAAADAFWEAFVDFSRPQIRAALRTLATKGRELAGLMETDLSEKVKTLAATPLPPPTATSSTTATGSAASLVLTPADVASLSRSVS